VGRVCSCITPNVRPGSARGPGGFEFVTLALWGGGGGGENNGSGGSLFRYLCCATSWLPAELCEVSCGRTGTEEPVSLLARTAG